MKHTPGPWYIMNSSKEGFLNVFGTHNTGEFEACDFVCEIGPGARKPGYEANANAKLIAAAPDLADALMDLIIPLSEEEIDSEPRYSAAKEALQKAGVL